MADLNGKFTCMQCSGPFQMIPGQHVTCPRCQHAYAVWHDWKRFVAAAEKRRKLIRKKGKV